jgi:hypothetical protein
MFIAHDIEFGDPEQMVSETIPAMRELQAAGKTRFIEISRLPLEVLAEVAVRAGEDFYPLVLPLQFDDSRSGSHTHSDCGPQSYWRG